MKAGLGLAGLSVGFFVLAWGAANATPDSPVSPAWLVVTYFLFTVGELCISPIGLSAITKLSPTNRVGQMMGIWFVGAALGNLFAGLVGGRLESMEPDALFRTVALTTGTVALVALVLAPQVRKLIGRAGTE
jgi:POT family proton-dependent oligopeptide transporter